MRRVIVLLAGLAVSGCTTSQVLERDPKIVTTSTQEMAALKRCLMVGLAGVGPASEIPEEGGATLTFGGGGVTYLTVTLKGASPISVTARSGGAMNGVWKRRIEACAARGDWR